MQTIVYNISQAVATAIIHSMWQALLLFALLRLVNLCMVNKQAAIRYKLSVLALLGIAAWFALTFAQELYQANWNINAPTPAGLSHSVWNGLLAPKVIALAYHSYSVSYQPYLPYISILYGTGLLLQFGRLVAGRQMLSRLKKSVVSNDVLTRQVAQLSRQLGIHKLLVSGLSPLTSTPCIAGYLKPILFLPITAYTHLSVDEVQALLLHELAHIKRNDYVVNLVQQVILTLLFFNPLVWLINRSINEERENSCDDMVIQHTGQPLLYAQTLIKLQELQAEELPLVIAATGQKYHLLNRIKRIMETQKATVNPRHILLTLLLMAGSITSIAWLEPKVKDGQITIKKVKLTALFSHVLQDTVPPPPAPPAVPPVTVKPPKPPKPPKIKSGTYTYNFKDAQLEKLAAEVEKHGNAIQQYYSAPEFLRLQTELDKAGKDIDAFYSRPELKNIEAELDKQSKTFDAVANNADADRMNKQMEQLSQSIETYFNSAEYKRLEKDVEGKADLLGQVKDFNSDTYKKRKAEMDKAIDALHKYLNNPQIKQQQNEIAQLGSQVKKFYSEDSAFARERNKLKVWSDSLHQAYNNPQIKNWQQNMRNVQVQLRKYQTSPYLIKEQKLLQQASLRLQQYQNSPAFKKRLAQAQKLAMTNRQTNFDITLDRPERPERIEMPEKPEPKEAPEQAEPRL